MNEGYIAAFKIACDEIDDEAFKADAKVFASKGKVGEENEFYLRRLGDLIPLMQLSPVFIFVFSQKIGF